MSEIRQRSYIRRRGRLTHAQARALREQEQKPEGSLHIHPDRDGLSWPRIFGREAALAVEIGFGMGHALLDWAQARPDLNILGIELYEPGIGAALNGLQDRQLHNVRVVAEPAEEVFARYLRPASVAEVHIYFPDPWPKKRHHKRRLLQPDFVAALADRLCPGGQLLVATDWQPYAEWIMRVLTDETRLTNQFGVGCYAAEAADVSDSQSHRNTTRFEARGLRLGHEIFDFHFVRASGGNTTEQPA